MSLQAVWNQDMPLQAVWNQDMPLQAVWNQDMPPLPPLAELGGAGWYSMVVNKNLEEPWVQFQHEHAVIKTREERKKHLAKIRSRRHRKKIKDARFGVWIFATRRALVRMGCI
jgi:hypothetical protein